MFFFLYISIINHTNVMVQTYEVIKNLSLWRQVEDSLLHLPIEN